MLSTFFSETLAFVSFHICLVIFVPFIKSYVPLNIVFTPVTPISTKSAPVSRKFPTPSISPKPNVTPVANKPLPIKPVLLATVI